MKHKEEERKYQHERRDLLLSLGLCVSCKDKAEPGKSRCNLCLEQRRLNEAERRKELKRQKKCFQCGGITVFYKKCHRCRKKILDK